MPDDNLDDASKTAKQVVEEVAQPALRDFAGRPELRESFPALIFEVEQPKQDGEIFSCCCLSRAPAGRALMRGGPIAKFRITASATAKGEAVVVLSIKAVILGDGEREWNALCLPTGTPPLHPTAALNYAKAWYPEQLANCAAAIAKAG